ncbi:hypothetical protein M9Y10_040849 [Tritrichomonas musculus]|uniref:IC97/Casc1 N-terminal domain-containing protein n=1 Tax=Tritrichomonas musculus TaxID=1915356 RepID=A0ABR2K2R4_9EUKA
MSTDPPAEISIAPPDSDAATPEQLPPDTQDTAVPSDQPTGKKGKGKKEKKPKAKKLSKKERLRLKKEKEEQERLEQERREAELRDQREREYEQKKREEQQQRLIEEDSYIKNLRKERTEEGRKIRAAKAQADDWEIFKECNHFVDVRSQSDVNTFITQWREINETDLPILFEHFKQSNTIKKQLISMMETAEVSQETDEYNKFKEQIDSLNDIVSSKMEQITGRHLIFSDKFAGAKNEVQVSAQTDGMIFGMWVNLSKNPRIKEIEFPGLTVEIPKAVAMTSLAIRMLMTPEKKFNDEYLFLFKQILCDFLQLPTPPKKIGTMTLRQSPQKNILVNISYPLRNVNSTQPALNFKVQLEPGFITDYVKDATVVQIIPNSDNSNQDEVGVNTQHISKVNLDPETNTMMFSSGVVGTFCIAIQRYAHFPLKMWEFTGTSETSVEIYIKTCLDVELSINIDKDGLCSCESPEDIAFKDLSPVSAIKFLMEKGINLVAPKKAIAELTPKTPDLEEVLNKGIADTATGFMVSWSKWNEMLPQDRAMLIMKEMKTFDEDENEDENEEENNENENNQENNNGEEEDKLDQSKNQSYRKNKMRAMLVKSNHIVEVPYTEDQCECNMKPIDDAQIHQHILPMFFEKSSEEVKERVKKAPTFLCDASYYFLKQLRLFSMTKAETAE